MNKKPKTINVPDYNTDYKGWEAALKTHLLRVVLPSFVKNSQDRVKLVNKSAMKVWVKVFTHRSYDPGYNYEILERIGDKILDVVFTDYLRQRYKGDINEGEIAELNRAYMSKDFQSKLSRLYKFNYFVRTNTSKVDINIEEDLFEAFIGGLFDASNIAFGYGSGLAFSFNFITATFNKVEVNFSATMGNPANVLLQRIIERLIGKGPGMKPTFTYGFDERTKKVTAVINLTGRAVDAINRFLSPQNRITSQFLGRGTGPNRVEALKNAYIPALKKLYDKSGINVSWVEAIKQEQLVSRLDKSELAQLQTNLNLKGMVSYQTPKTTLLKLKNGSKLFFQELIGIDKDGNQFILETIEQRYDKDIKVNVLKRFAQSSH